VPACHLRHDRPGANDSATMRPLTSSLQRRRRPTPTRTSTRPRGFEVATIWSTRYATPHPECGPHRAAHRARYKVGAEARFQYTSERFQKLMSDHGVVCSMSRSGNVWDNAAMESFFSSLKTERTARKMYRTRDQAKADVFDYIECFYNPKRRHSTIGYLSPVEFEMQAGLA
jgi:transposase InsO family protein